ncbi:uncharacterized protein EV422DRAFT_602419 [Fimicolochytrium jonesii]|uniref:uncharacterized protein n=1 Tax=Fimicolochytrium jonesii TaxID=1396493 RepID=UPI0022FEB574|nr:uncharacterized protein EV422DRAFT_602419 [Fimicolochytrium jonesii]KAI8818376.1 hypothetical protein EV422DRAFT_602419 [Fimicolochytrium jonesii]
MPRPLNALFAVVLFVLAPAYLFYVTLRSPASTPSTDAHLSTPSSANAICLTVEGFAGCPYFMAAEKAAISAQDENRVQHAVVNTWDRGTWQSTRRAALQASVPGAQSHRTSPFVWRRSCQKVSGSSAETNPDAKVAEGSVVEFAELSIMGTMWRGYIATNVMAEKASELVDAASELSERLKWPCSETPFD